MKKFGFELLNISILVRNARKDLHHIGKHYTSKYDLYKQKLYHLSLFSPTSQAKALTALLAASSRSEAETIASPESSMIFLALSTFVPSRRTTSGICRD